MCLNNRHNNWNKNASSSGRYFQLLHTPSRAIHSSIFSHLTFASPNQPSLLSEKTLKENFNFKVLHEYSDEQNQDQYLKVVEISNDNDNETVDTSSSRRTDSTSTSSETSQVNLIK